MIDNLGMALIGAVIMAVAIWAPSVYVYIRKRRAGEAMTGVHLALALALELALFLTGAVTAQVLGFPAGEVLLIIALVVGAAGAHVLSSIGFPKRA